MNAKCNVKQSNLPLLFTNGSPTSLESMSLQQLQSFLLFLLKCESGHEVTSLIGLDQPKWWPADVLFHDDILGTNSKKGLWSSMLRKVIQKCYVYHNSDFLLDFSRRLMDVVQQNNGKVTIVDNGDGTRSMKSVVSEKLLVTFKSENQDYDKRMRQRENSFSTHSPMKGGFSLSSESNSSDPRLPLCSDLYLCDICGDDFESLQEVLAHEKSCEKNRQILPDVPSNQTEANKSHYLNYLRLGKVENQNQDENHTRLAAPSAPSNVVRPKPGSYAKFLSIDVSSPLGQYINDLTKSASDSIDIKALCQMERKTVALRSSYGQRGARRTRFPVTFRGPKDRLAQKQSPHQYCFTREQFRQRIQTLKTGLSPKTLQLMKRLSKQPPKVNVERLQFRNYPNVDPEEVQRILEKDRAVRLAQRVAAEKIAAEKMAAAKVSLQQQEQQEDAAALQNVIMPKLLIHSPFKPKAVTTTTTHHYSPQPKAEYDNSFYHSFMYANHPSSNGNVNHHISKYVSVSTNGNFPSKVVECIDLSSTDDEEDEIEIDDPEDEDDDDVTTLSDFEDDENLAMAIKRVPGAASVVLGMSASDPLRII